MNISAVGVNQLAQDGVSFADVAVLIRATLDANRETGAIYDFTITAYAERWRLSWAGLDQALRRLEARGLVSLTRTRGHDSTLWVLAHGRVRGLLAEDLMVVGS